MKVLGGGTLQLRVIADNGEASRTIQLDAGVERQRSGAGRARPGRDTGTIHGRSDRTDTGVVASDGLDGDAFGDVCDEFDGPALKGRSANGVEVEQGGESLHGGEAPLLLTTARHRDVGGVEGCGPFSPGGDVTGLAVGVGSLQRRARVIGEKVGH